MPNINTARFSLTGTDTVRALKDRLEDRWVTVQDFGAVGDGSTNDRGAIQAALDYAYGPESDPNGQADSDLNKVVFFPRGLYKIAGAPLNLNKVFSPTLIGAGSHQSRIFWSGAAAEGSYTSYPVIECRGCWHTHMEGLTFDAGGIQNIGMHVGEFDGAYDDGSDGYYRDVHFTGAVKIGGAGGHGILMGHSGALSSERLFIKCKFTNCADQGIRLLHLNSINYAFIGCRFTDCAFGIRGITGHSVLVDGCSFENNSAMDVRVQVGVAHIQDCHSTSQFFTSVSGTLVSNTHDNASAGEFYSGWNDVTRDYMNSDICTGKLIGNHSTSGIVRVDGNLGTKMGVRLLGNVFDNPDYFDDTLANPYPTVLFVDGTDMSIT